MKNKTYLMFWLLLSFVSISQTQERPPINIFNPVEYGAEPQNWSISQSKERYIYVANNKGLLEYNGAKWTLYPSPNGTIMRSVKVIDSLIFTGNHYDFGYWKKNNFGNLNYTSLSNELKVTFLEDEEFWNIMSLDNWVLFQSLDRIHFYNKITKAYKVINPETNVTKLFKANQNFYFQDLNKGLYKIEKGEAVLVSDNDILKNNRIVNTFYHNNSILILTQDLGFFKLSNGILNPWNIPANKFIKNESVFSAIQLKDKSFMLGTISNGIIHISPNGNLNSQVGQSNGLSNNTVLSLYEDMDNNVWLGLDNGINCINLKSPYHVYFDKNGTIGSVYASKIFNKNLYLGTNQGLFYKPLNKQVDFQFIEGTQGQVWFLDVIDNKLFCGHNSGTFIVDNNKAKRISSEQGTWQIKTIEGYKNLLIQGNYDGLNILEKNKNGWEFRNKIEGFNVSSRYFEFLNKEEVFVSHEYKGLYKIKLDKDLKKVLQVTKDSLINQGLYSGIIKYNNDLLYSGKRGILKFNLKTNQFEKDTFLSKLIDFDKFTSGKLIPCLATNKLWGFSTEGLNYVTSSKLSGDKKINKVTFPFEIRKDVTGFENIIHLEKEKYLLGSTTGYTILNLDQITNLKHEITINQIITRQLKNNNSINQVNLNSEVELENKENNIQFSYSISEFLKTQKPEYQYKLEGIYDTWSNWTTNGTVTFENLPYRDYTFKVRGRVGNQKTLNTASFSFRIEKPLYATNTAIALYILILILLGVIFHNIHKRYYRKQRERLMQKTARELELKELENKQQLMRFKNEKLREDIENKNRELGISTMNLIKKNEFFRYHKART